MIGPRRSPACCGAALVALAAVFSLPREGLATTVVAKSFESICRDADVVFVGSVSRVESRWAAPEKGTIDTLVTFSNLVPLFGVEGNEVVLRFGGGAVDGMREEVAGVPHFEVGDRVVVFARHGRLVSPIVGFHQGLFRVVEREGVPVVLNEGRFPVTGVEGQALRFGGTAEEGGAAMALDEFLGHVRDTLGNRTDAAP